MKTLLEIKNKIELQPARSAWERGVKNYALDLVSGLIDEHNDDYIMDNKTILKKELLNGARDWHEYSWGGLSKIYDCDIAKMLCSPSELKRKDNGRLRPNKKEEWLDTQARALFQAEMLIQDNAE